MGRGRRWEEREAKAALEGRTHQIGGEGGVLVGGDGMEEVTRMRLGGTNEHGGVTGVRAVGEEV